MRFDYIFVCFSFLRFRTVLCCQLWFSNGIMDFFFCPTGLIEKIITRYPK